MRNSELLVSIGLPVYNGEAYLETALNSILNQTWTAWELIISDNASTDQTEAICQIYVARDQRIRYYRNDQNVGAVRNFNRVFNLSLGQYFKWFAHDDIIHPSYIERCVAVLDSDPSIVLCSSKIQIIGENDKFKSNDDPSLALHNMDSFQPENRFSDLILIPHYCYDIFGLIRTSTLHTTPLLASHIGSDRNLLAELGLRGRLCHIPEAFFFSRDHSQRSIQAMSLHERGVWFDVDNKERVMLPRWSLYVGYFRSVKRAPLTSLQRRRCYFVLTQWLFRYGKGLLKDLVVSAPALYKQVKKLAKNRLRKASVNQNKTEIMQ